MFLGSTTFRNNFQVLISFWNIIVFCYFNPLVRNLEKAKTDFSGKQTQRINTDVPQEEVTKKVAIRLMHLMEKTIKTVRRSVKNR